MRPRAIVSIVLGIALLLMLSSNGRPAAAAGSPVPIRIGWQVPSATQALIVEVLKRTDVLEAHGLEPSLVPFSFGRPQVEAALGGRLDVLFIGDQPALDMISRDPRWKIVGRLYYDRDAIMVPPGSSVRDVGDLRGREVATPFESTAHREATLKERASGLDPDADVDNTDLDILEIRRRVLSGGIGTWGSIDAVAVWEPLISQFQLEQRARILTSSPSLGVIAVSEEFIANHPKAAAQFLVGVKRAWLYVSGHAERVVQWYMDDAQLGYSPKAILSAARLDPNWGATSLQDVDLRLSAGDLDDLKRAAAWGQARGYIGRDFELGRAIDDALLDRAERIARTGSLEAIKVILPTAREVPLADVQPVYLLDRLPLWFMFIGMVVAAFAAIEVGQWIGKRRRRLRRREPEGPVGTAVGAVLALLAFVIALTFSEASSRFDARKQALLDEVNAIGTAYLRADLLPEPQRTTARLLLRDYVEIRLGMYRYFDQPDKLRTVQGRTSALQDSIWSRADELAASDPRSQVNSLFIAAVNDVFDLHTKRIVLGAEYRIPVFVWYALGMVSLLAMTAVGFQFGIGGRRSLMASLSLSLAFALVILLILDLDRSGQGLIEVNQQPMLDLYQSLGRAE